MIVHCNMKVRPEVIWFLHDDELFMERKLEITTCPKCLKHLAKLTERRKTDSRFFECAYSESKAEKLISDCAGEIMYTSDDMRTKKVLHGWVYGENKESVDKRTGKKIITQKACDFHGNKQTIRRESN